MPNPNIWNYVTADDGVIERRIKISSKKSGRPIRISQITDLHFNLCNERDFCENDPVLMSTYEKREWLKNGNSVENALRSLKHAEGSDAIVITGDILDYLSYGCEELAIKHIFKAYPDIIASLGNHETARKVQGIYPETMTIEEKEERLKRFWPNNLHYSSKIIDERVMIIQMDNCSSKIGFREDQIERLSSDIEKARKKDYIALLFFHIHISPESEKYSSADADEIGDKSWTNIDLNRHGIRAAHGEASAKICDIIRSSADVIKGCFCGHAHSDFYCEISATDALSPAVIPQYILIGTPYGDGHILHIDID